MAFGELAADQKNAMVGGPFGSNLVSSDYTEAGTPVIRGQNLGLGRWVGGDFVFVSEQKALSLRSNWAMPGDIVFTQRGTLGQVAIVPPGPWKHYLISQRQMKATIDPSQADPSFIYYLFTSPVEQRYIIGNAIQVGVPHINLAQLRAHPISIPPLAEQGAISAVLGALDDKIEQNRHGTSPGAAGAGNLPGLVRRLRASQGQSLRRNFVPRHAPTYLRFTAE